MKTAHPDKPAEAEEIIIAIQELWKLQKSGRWDIEELGKWLRQYPDQICSAAERIEAHYNELYPPKEDVPCQHNLINS